MRKESESRRTVFTFVSRVMERSRNSVLLKENFTTSASFLEKMKSRM